MLQKVHYYEKEGAVSTEKVKRGYLIGDYHLFHIKDKRDIEVGWHYHDFDKIVVFLSGRVTYLVEGKSYFLKPWDILLVGRGQIHRTLIDGSALYERIVIYLDPDFMRREGVYECFERALSQNFCLIRADRDRRLGIMRHVTGAEEAQGSAAFGARLMEKTNILQLLIELSRAFSPELTEESAFRCDPLTQSILDHIKSNLDGDLSVDGICGRFYISRSKLLHTFKEQTGYTLHKYVTQKRVLRSAELIRKGDSVLAAAEKSGFSDYSAFLRAFKSTFGVLPKSFGS